MATGKSEVFRLNVVDQDGVNPGLVFDSPEDGATFKRILKVNPNGSTSWMQKEADDIPQAESPDGDYSDLNTYGVTWHHNK